MSYIEIQNYTKKIKGNTVLENINLNLESGQIYGFIGKNGSGKTMLFRAICGLIKPTTGHVMINEEIITKDIDFPRSCGVIIETPGFWEDLTGFQCLKIIADIKDIATNADIIDWMKTFELDPYDKKNVKKYSLGMKQKLALVQAFMEKPDLIILDEPTNSLDEDAIRILHNVILNEKKRGATILIASHHKEDITLLSNQILEIRQGKIININNKE
ncbi:ABC transporter ATP-binding protein [Anaerosporobacter sp.]